MYMLSSILNPATLRRHTDRAHTLRGHGKPNTNQRGPTQSPVGGDFQVLCPGVLLPTRPTCVAVAAGGIYRSALVHPDFPLLAHHGKAANHLRPYWKTSGRPVCREQDLAFAFAVPSGFRCTVTGEYRCMVETLRSLTYQPRRVRFVSTVAPVLAREIERTCSALPLP